ncbi:MAG: peptidase M15 [Prevotellaceae bacterium]|jgi:uncharacterized protein YcbK (DUF882 family)|nr:peptidase M15 [Prevotellaceae bacterium]
MKYFTIKELSETNTGLQNIPTQEAIANLENLVEKILDPVREFWGAPIIVNSGYRSEAVNIAVGGVASSQHLKGEAADITVGNPTKNRQLFEMLANGGYEFDQLIDEKNYTWIHVSLKRSGNNRRQILHLK